MSESVRQLVRAGYDRVAPDHLAARPTDDADARLLDELAGCLAPGAAGYTVVGFDVSDVQGDLASLPFRTGALRAAVSFYAIVHVPRDDHVDVFRELRRVVEPDGHVLVCLGARDVPADRDPRSWLGAPMYWSHFDAETNVEMLQQAGLTVMWHRLVDDPMGHADHLFALARR